MQGTLRDFRLAEILQLVAVQQKTGLLRVQSHDTLLTFYFDNGLLVSCRDRRRLATDPLLDYLTSVGFLDASTSDGLRSELEETKQDLVHILLERSILTLDDIEIALDDLAQELVYRTYPWNEGTYRFISGEEALQGLTHTISRQVEGLLMEAARRSDEWPRLLEKLPGEGVLVDAVRSSTEGLDERTLAVLNMLSKPARMGELVERARMPEYDVYETVAAAIEAGMTSVLEVPEKKAGAPGATSPGNWGRKPSFRERRQLPPALFWILSLWMFVSIVGAAYLLSSRIDARPGKRTSTSIDVERARADIEHQLEVYRAIHGRFPARLEELSESELLSRERLDAAGISHYRSNADGETYRLTFADLEP